ncbi:hypothetical protein IQ254_06345 [Nodosilinea sp. LEGE 07088]|uniref:hypothetical protein n=1 Tax=Nodosilinea sp. LEGE 07088 TaxID=2777968 RepID=UPI001880473D|nr:hypothetical protein [Nodosilinea sp. LEGE 07088]MBE9136827.1 hypothetical protein [Nodosilinea sp. LEGE 07088]
MGIPVMLRELHEIIKRKTLKSATFGGKTRSKDWVGATASMLLIAIVSVSL